MKNNMLRSNDNKSYNQILKTTTVFGSVKIFSVLINLFKAKIIAIFLGPAGLGIYNLIQYQVNIFSQVSNLGISTSGIREVAQATNQQTINEVSTVIKYWNRITGVIGSILLLILAAKISIWTFGNKEYTWAFQILSLAVFCTALGNEYEVLLRGLRQTKLVAKAGFYSALIGFLLSIPFYYLWNTSGIVAVILITSVSLASINYFYAQKSKIKNVKLPLKEIFFRGKNMALLGFYIMLGDILFTVIISIVNIYIRNTGGVSDVGLFQACMQITNSSINIVLVAMAADYFPRLANCQGNKKESRLIASQQTEIAVLLSTPIIVSLIIFAPTVINILLSNDFISIRSAISWFILATIFRLPSWSLNYYILANGKTKLYILFVLINTLTLLISYCTGYYIGGIKGMGIAYIIQLSLYTIIQNIIIRIIFNIYLNKQFWTLYTIGCLICIFSLYIAEAIDNQKYIFGCLIVCSAFIYSTYFLVKKTSIINLLKKNRPK